MASIQTIEGVGASHAKKLAKAGIRSVEGLLEQCCDKQGRKAAAKACGFGEKTLLKWANFADLMRIKGVGEEYSELLEAAGVDTVKELKLRRADNLVEALARANERKKLVRRVPGEKVVAGWIRQAKRLKPVIRH
jgi:predicted flap endonuclease-1-like 5' DNA nuclease